MQGNIKTVLDSGFWIPGTELRIPISSGIPYSLSWIDSKAQVNKFLKLKKFPGFQNLYSLTWGQNPYQDKLFV